MASSNDTLYQYLLLLADNALILGHRLSEWCGHGPNLETDIAMTNLSLDLFGQVRNYYQYAGTLCQPEKSEDEIAFLRLEHEYRNVQLVEYPNRDFAYTMARQFLYDAYHLPLLEQLMHSQDEQLAAIAAKSVKEVRYHLRLSSEWVKRLGAGTEESHQRMQNALTDLWPYTHEYWKATPVETAMHQAGIGADLLLVKVAFDDTVHEVFAAATLPLPTAAAVAANGKNGVHTEEMGYVLAQLQYMQRAYPNMAW